MKIHAVLARLLAITYGAIAISSFLKFTNIDMRYITIPRYITPQIENTYPAGTKYVDNESDTAAVVIPFIGNALESMFTTNIASTDTSTANFMMSSFFIDRYIDNVIYINIAYGIFL